MLGHDPTGQGRVVDDIYRPQSQLLAQANLLLLRGEVDPEVHVDGVLPRIPWQTKYLPIELFQGGGRFFPERTMYLTLNPPRPMIWGMVPS